MFYEHIGNGKSRGELEQSLKKELHGLDTKRNKNVSTETELAGLMIRDKISDEAYNRQRSLIIVERNWIDKRKEAITKELEALNQQAEAMDALDQIKATLSDGFVDLSNDQWRELFKTLNLQVYVQDKEEPKRTWRGKTVEGYSWVDIRFGISIVPVKEVSDIVFARAYLVQ